MSTDTQLEGQSLEPASVVLGGCDSQSCVLFGPLHVILVDLEQGFSPLELTWTAWDGPVDSSFRGASWPGGRVAG